MTQIPNEPSYDKSEHSENIMGYSIRVDQYRFTEWYRFNRTTAIPNFTDIYGTELYDHTAPTTFFNDENVNLVGESQMQKHFDKCYRQVGEQHCLHHLGLLLHVDEAIYHRICLAIYIFKVCTSCSYNLDVITSTNCSCFHLL